MTRTCKVSDLFEVKYGVNLELNALTPNPNGINFVSRTSKNNGVSAKVLPLEGVEPIPAGTISVAGGGSVMESFLQISPYYSGFHLFYLTPRVRMTNAEKLFYCICLRRNKHRYSYGRQANTTLPDLLIPTLVSIPQAFRDFSIKEFSTTILKQLGLQENSHTYKKPPTLVPLSSLFSIENGIASTSVARSKIKENENWFPYIRPSYRQETSVDAYVNIHTVPQNKIFPSQTLYVSTNGQGSHTFSYVTIFDFVPNSDVSVLIPKRPMSPQEKLFYAHCITKNRYKFSYGRKPKGHRLASIMLPQFPPNYMSAYSSNNVIKSFEAILDKL